MDLRTKYLGLELKHPIVASPSPLCHRLEGIKRLEDAGASAIVLASLFEEQIRFENESMAYFDHITSNNFAESLTFFPKMDEFYSGPDEYLDLIRRATECCDIPIIASLNATSTEGWTDYASGIEKAGAKALELNAYYIPDVGQSSDNVELRYVDMVRLVRAAVNIPIAVKLTPYFSSMGDMAQRLVAAGADGLVLFNRLYQPDFNLDLQEVETTLELSSSSEIRLSLLWIGNLYGQVECCFGGTTGVHRGSDALKYILAGADVAMTTSALLKNGTGHLMVILAEIIDWCDRHRCESFDQIRGAMSRVHVLDPSAFDRANYVKVLQSYMPKHSTPSRYKRYEDFGL